jgi:hypothetical protein
MTSFLRGEILINDLMILFVQRSNLYPIIIFIALFQMVNLNKLFY